MKKNYIIILFLLVFTVFISGCIGFLTTPGEDSIAPGKGRLKIYLTDSSEDYKAGDAESYLAVNITISEIKVHFAGDDDNDEGEWIEWVLAEPSEYNLIELKDVFVLLSEGELAPGKYTQIRLFITEASVLVEIEATEEENGNGKDIVIEIPSIAYDVEIPSADQTGIKLIHPFEIIEGETTKLTIDFDAEKSIIKTDNGEYKLKPVIKVITNFSTEGEDVEI